MVWVLWMVVVVGEGKGKEGKGNEPLDEVRPLFARPSLQLFVFPHFVECGRDLGTVFFAVDEVGDEDV